MLFCNENRKRVTLLTSPQECINQAASRSVAPDDFLIDNYCKLTTPITIKRPHISY